MDEPASSSPLKHRLTARQRELVSAAIEGILLIGVLVFVVNVWNQKHVTVKNHTVTVQASPKIVTLTPTPVPAPKASEALSVPIDSLVAGYKLTMQVPTAWRAVDIRSLVSASDYADYNMNDLAAILRFVPEHTERATLYPAIEPINTLDVVGTSRWATVNDGAPLTPANKQSYLGYLGSLRTVSDIGAAKCTPINMDGSVCADAKVRPQIIHSADGTLSGMAYLVLGTQSVSYDPSVVVEMVGSVAGKPVHVSGVFRVYDEQYTTLGGDGVNTKSNAADYVTKVQESRAAFANNPPADTLDIYNRIVAAVQSMRFSK
ncbi:MAG TPA: hypothetical protein VGH44_05570 [Candidatus Saccharimonadia bacterium]|jgi:hypothetical protein